MADPEFAELENSVIDSARADAEEEQSADLLGMLRLPGPLISCCDTLCFSLLTIFLLLDILSNIGVVIIYAVHQHYVFLTMSSSVFVLTALLTSLVYTAHMRHTHSILMLLGCFLINLPGQLGILGHHVTHMYRRCHIQKCCSGQQEVQKNSRQARNDANIWWIFIKLDLLHSSMNSVPQMVINSLYILQYRQTYLVQYIALASSFLLLVLSAVLHEKVRKERSRDSPYGCLPMICIIVYRTLVFAARIIAFVVFSLYFGPYVAVVLLPHLFLVFVFFVFLYHQVWRVNYMKILMHSICCVIAYFPVHCEYRPEGEIVLYYIIYMLENILMACLAFVYEPIMPYTEDLMPWSNFHKIATVAVLFCSSAGLIFMGIYYFLFHVAHETISETNLSWLANICEWTKVSDRKHSPHTATFSNPVFLDDPSMTSRAEHPINENVTSPLWGGPPYHAPREMPNNRISVVQPSIYNETTMDNDIL